jgi:uncharacterized protein
MKRNIFDKLKAWKGSPDRKPLLIRGARQVGKTYTIMEFALKDISFPVARLQMMNMYPMGFSEFLIANNKALLAEKIKDPGSQLSSTTIQLINNEMYNYFIVGGMPECVNAFTKTGSLMEAIQIQTDLMATFRQDFSKYAGHSDKRCLNAV